MAVSAVYTGGLSLGILKPYFVDVVTAGGNQDSLFRSTYPTILDSGYLVDQSSGFGAGFSKLSIKPGLNAKAALRFDYGRFNQSITAVLPVQFFEMQAPVIFAVTEKQSGIHAPPPSSTVAVYIRNCVFLI